MTTRRHYSETSVPESKSLAEIETLLRRHKVKATRWTNMSDLVRLEFTWDWEGHGLSFRIDLAIPEILDGYKLQGSNRDQERRRRLRILFNHIKAKLVAVEEGLVEMQREFLPYLLSEGGETAGDIAMVQLQGLRELGQVPSMKLISGPTRQTASDGGTR